MRAKRTAVFAAKRFRFWHPNVNLKYSSKVLSTRLRIFKIAIQPKHDIMTLDYSGKGKSEMAKYFFT